MKFKVKNESIKSFIYKGEVFKVKNGIVDIPEKYVKTFEANFRGILEKTKTSPIQKIKEVE